MILFTLNWALNFVLQKILGYYGLVKNSTLLKVVYSRWRKASSEARDSVSGNLLGEIDKELDEQTALFERVLVLGHALAVDVLDVAVLDDFTRNGGQDQLAVVQSLDTLLEAAQRLH